MPRKRLMDFDENSDKGSPRFNFRMDEEVKNVLQQTKDKSQFIREAIIYYWEHVGDRDYRSTEFIPREEPSEPKKSKPVESSTWKAPWLSS